MHVHIKRLRNLFRTSNPLLTILTAYILVVLVNSLCADQTYLFWTLNVMSLGSFLLLFLLSGVTSFLWAAHIDPYRQMKYSFLAYVFYIIAITPIASTALGYSVLLLPLVGYQLFKLKRSDVFLGLVLLFSAIKGCILLRISQIDDQTLWGRYALTHQKEWHALSFLLIFGIVLLAGYLLYLAWVGRLRGCSSGTERAFTSESTKVAEATEGSTTSSEVSLGLRKAFNPILDRYVAWESQNPMGLKLVGVAFLLLFFFHTALLIRLMILRVDQFSTPTYDFGIFSQMFANMHKGLGPVTTLERDRWLSHFDVHMSPIYYLLYPLYYLFPNPKTLQVGQILVVYSGLIPFWLLVKRLTKDKGIRVLSILLYLAMPAFALNNLYDLHENCFLPPLLLCLAYACVSKRFVLQFICTVAVLAVKEDAGLYLVFLGLFFFFTSRFHFSLKEKIWIAASDVVLPLIYVFFIIDWLNQSGAGAMTDRFSNLMLPGQTSLLSALINCLLNPTFALSGMFTYDKLAYLFLVLLPLGFLPLINRKPAQLFLAMPLVVINLLSAYKYQYQLTFQYGYGSTALLLFSALLVICEIKSKRRLTIVKAALVLTSLLTIFIFYQLHLSGRIVQLGQWDRVKEKHLRMAEQLNQLPRDRVILADGFLTTRLSDVSELYDLKYHHHGNFDPAIQLLVIPRQAAGENEIYHKYIEQGYQESKFSTEDLIVLEKAADPQTQTDPQTQPDPQGQTQK